VFDSSESCAESLERGDAKAFLRTKIEKPMAFSWGKTGHTQSNSVVLLSSKDSRPPTAIDEFRLKNLPGARQFDARFGATCGGQAWQTRAARLHAGERPEFFSDSRTDVQTFSINLPG
jgi:hypothetical protein